jgi:hypothetical protein
MTSLDTISHRSSTAQIIRFIPPDPRHAPDPALAILPAVADFPSSQASLKIAQSSSNARTGARQIAVGTAIVIGSAALSYALFGHIKSNPNPQTPTTSLPGTRPIALVASVATSGINRLPPPPIVYENPAPEGPSGNTNQAGNGRSGPKMPSEESAATQPSVSPGEGDRSLNKTHRRSPQRRHATRDLHLFAQKARAFLRKIF